MKHTEIKSELIMASRNAETGDILWTFKWTYPRMILAEVNTHRVFSRNTASSRAIPTKKFRSRILHDPFVPTHIGTNQKGMQAGAELSGIRRKAAVAIWRGARYGALAAAYGLEKLGAHKQIANRLLEPWMWTEQVVTFTEYENFLGLRAHWMAEPHLQKLAYQVKSQIENIHSYFEWADRNPNEVKSRVTFHWPDGDKSVIQTLEEGEWHLPFVDEQDIKAAEARAITGSCTLDQLKVISAARCARVSYYLPENGKRSSWEKDKELHDRLVVRGCSECGLTGMHKMSCDTRGKNDNDDPIHASPVEHQARAMHDSSFIGNFRGWRQYRKDFPNESGSSR